MGGPGKREGGCTCSNEMKRKKLLRYAERWDVFNRTASHLEDARADTGINKKN